MRSLGEEIYLKTRKSIHFFDNQPANPRFLNISQTCFLLELTFYENVNKLYMNNIRVVKNSSPRDFEENKSLFTLTIKYVI